jgi:hypothetical protein
LGESPASELYVQLFRNTPFHLHVLPAYTTYKYGTEQSVPKRRHIKFRRRRFTQKRNNITFRTQRKFEIKQNVTYILLVLIAGGTIYFTSAHMPEFIYSPQTVCYPCNGYLYSVTSLNNICAHSLWSQTRVTINHLEDTRTNTRLKTGKECLVIHITPPFPDAN